MWRVARRPLEGRSQIREVPMSAAPTILVVDGDDSTRRQLQTLLELYGYAVVTAAGGQGVLDRLQDHLPPRPRVILLDGTDGWRRSTHTPAQSAPRLSFEFPPHAIGRKRQPEFWESALRLCLARSANKVSTEERPRRGGKDCAPRLSREIHSMQLEDRSPTK